jgi:hypothetical protein
MKCHESVSLLRYLNRIIYWYLAAAIIVSSIGALYYFIPIHFFGLHKNWYGLVLTHEPSLLENIELALQHSANL